ncbi:MAG: F0F1 ATP synthase subunit delta [Clostridia bacterium]|nr:F0F1 ATP synthase subunit delta [Clostridia bacterium]
MIDRSVARRYGKALFAIAEEKNQINRFQQELHLIVSALADNQKFAKLFLGKAIGINEKKELVRKLFGEQFSVYILNLLFLVLDKGREDYIYEISRLFDQMVNEAAGIVPVSVTAAVPLADDELAKIAKTLQNKFDKPISIKAGVDKALLGGLKVQIGNTVYDGSIAHQLEALRQQLSK